MNNGDMADFTNCIIFLTSDLSNSQSSMGFQEARSDKDNLMIHPDILKHVDECFPLKEIDERGLRRILWMKLKRLKNRLKDSDIELNFDFKYIKSIIDSLSNEKVKIEALNKKILSEITPYVSSSILDGNKKIQLLIEKQRVHDDHKS